MGIGSPGLTPSGPCLTNPCANGARGVPGHALVARRAGFGIASSPGLATTAPVAPPTSKMVPTPVAP